MEYPSYYTQEEIALIEQKKAERKEDAQKILHILQNKSYRYAKEVMMEIDRALLDRTFISPSQSI